MRSNTQKYKVTIARIPAEMSSIPMTRSMCRKGENGTWTCLCDDLTGITNDDGEESKAYELSSFAELKSKLLKYYIPNSKHSVATMSSMELRIDAMNRVFMVLAANWKKHGKRLSENKKFMRMLYFKLEDLDQEWPEADDHYWGRKEFISFFDGVFFAENMCNHTFTNKNGRVYPCMMFREEPRLDFPEGYTRSKYCRDHESYSESS
jgi:hypothetical protein